jgi:uncharacterized protein YuzE
MIRSNYAIELDADANLLYLRLADRPIASTIEVEEDVLVDLDDIDHVVGIEFLDAARFAPFMRATPSIQGRVSRLLATNASSAD